MKKRPYQRISSDPSEKKIGSMSQRMAGTPLAHLIDDVKGASRRRMERRPTFRWVGPCAKLERAVLLNAHLERYAWFPWAIMCHRTRLVCGKAFGSRSDDGESVLRIVSPHARPWAVVYVPASSRRCRRTSLVIVATGRHSPGRGLNFSKRADSSHALSPSAIFTRSASCSDLGRAGCAYLFGFSLVATLLLQLRFGLASVTLTVTMLGLGLWGRRAEHDRPSLGGFRVLVVGGDGALLAPEYHLGHALGAIVRFLARGARSERQPRNNFSSPKGVPRARRSSATLLQRERGDR